MKNADCAVADSSSVCRDRAWGPKSLAAIIVQDSRVAFNFIFVCLRLSLLPFSPNCPFVHSFVRYSFFVSDCLLCSPSFSFSFLSSSSYWAALVRLTQSHPRPHASSSTCRIDLTPSLLFHAHASPSKFHRDRPFVTTRNLAPLCYHGRRRVHSPSRVS